MGRSGPERAVEAAVVTGADRLGGIAIKLDPSTYAGIPDRLVLLPGKECRTCGRTGHALLVETKAPKGIVSKLQQHWHKLMGLIGFPVAVPYTVEQVKALLAGYEKR